MTTLRCVGCHRPVVEDAVFCKTCADRRKVPNNPRLSDPSELAPSKFKVSGPEGALASTRIVGGFTDKPELDPEARLRWIIQGGLIRAKDGSTEADQG